MLYLTTTSSQLQNIALCFLFPSREPSIAILSYSFSFSTREIIKNCILNATKIYVSNLRLPKTLCSLDTTQFFWLRTNFNSYNKMSSLLGIIIPTVHTSLSFTYIFYQSLSQPTGPPKDHFGPKSTVDHRP